ncbi:nudix (nucleoside diphosphate linked moiety X)-type motif 8 [Apophysomyces ossiformis]|uniref:Nudix (Nucleoside diphosphate linked moiety X)-type motif 8 n=1 Tax=Apophysomyces ossiformis TaxID=679940 RepID=A0A8H7BEW1_9FUNG|nr:nudix (nucleoside diphosphate linked moiety X)-type motif 8 [Apophysomyces ossiformis]
MPIQFDVKTLSLFSRRLLNCPNYKFKYPSNVKDASVLMPLCHVDNEPSVLFTIRNKAMRTHQGEISFPGGKADPTDHSLEETALRETWEEIGIHGSAIDILGSYSPLPNKTGSLRVHPYVGYIRRPVDPTYIRFNPDEVFGVFCLPLSYLVRPDVREIRQFRGTHHKYTVFKVPEHIGENLEIWGLTSYILDGVLRKIIPEHYS